MTSRVFALTAALALTACASDVPDSNPNASNGVGFGAYDTYYQERQRRDLELQANRGRPVPEERAIAQETLGVLEATRPLGATVPGQVGAAPQPVQQTALAAAPAASAQVAASAPLTAPLTEPVPGNSAISDEQDFSAVSARETIESDRERLARQQQAYQVIQPQAIPERPSDTGPNIVEFALSTSNAVGQKAYRRSGGFNQGKYQRACAKYGSSDQAQAAFLAAGGPQRDRQGLDPDGDGFACFWDPSPFRAARGG